MPASPHHILALCLLPVAAPGLANASEPASSNGLHNKGRGTFEASANSPSPFDPYPVMATGWGPELGQGFMASRWAEDWSGMAAAGRAPRFKAIPIGDSAHLTLSSEVRLMQVMDNNAQLLRGNDRKQAQLRAVFGADLRLSPNVRTYAEVAAGHVDGRPEAAAANFENDASLQQLFVDVRGHVGALLVGAIVGRQEFSDGPRQLISLSDGPNLHRTWNGVRLYGHGTRMRFGAFALRGTQLAPTAFDEKISDTERLHGLNASFIVSPRAGPNIYLDPFWIHSESASFRVAGRAVNDDRDTVGGRLWGRLGRVRFDWAVARQTGHTANHRPIEAWGVFAVQSLQLSESGWKPRLTSRIDVASGGGAYNNGPVRDFNPLYASSNYLGEGQFLALSNLLMIASGVTVSPSQRATVSVEYGVARRVADGDAVYAGGLRPYAGTEQVTGNRIGGLARVSATWTVAKHMTLSANLEHLEAGSILEAAGFRSGTYSYISATYRY